ncbi:MAG: endonuclease/exonuclease/phosphatase family protein [Lysobacterales bacterium]|jgi:endonuclease/exonuclease/phosphatase family metal-dependent hydrolase
MIRRVFRKWIFISMLAAPAAHADDLRVMTFNIEYGGHHVSWDNVKQAIRDAKADIVGIQEAEGNLAQLADELGWHYDRRNYVISRFPVIEPPGADGKYVWVETEPGNGVAMANVHLPSDPYGPYQVRDGVGLEDVITMERATRLPMIGVYARALLPLIQSDVPLFLTGDFNAPSHRDWTPETVGKRPFLKYPVPWPVSRAMERLGFKDSFRAVHPDPVKDPGLTWWSGRPPLDFYAPGENDPQDRIDFVWFAGPAKALSSEVVGEKGGPGVSIGLSPWPSDHRAVVSLFRVEPVALPDLVTTARRVYRVGQDVIVRYHLGKDEQRKLSLWRAGFGQPITSIEVNGDGNQTFETTELGPGHYRATLEAAGAVAPMNREFWVQALDAVPALEVQAEHFKADQPIPLQWSNAPGNRNDYIGIYPENVEPGYESAVAWAYVDALPDGSLTLDKTTSSGVWPLAPGRYVARLIEDDGAATLAKSKAFVVE